MARADVQTSLRMSEDLRDRLAAAAEENGYGIGVEICRRLEKSFKSELQIPAGVDPKSAELLQRIVHAVRFIGKNKDDGAWHETPWAHLALKAALDALLEPYRPEGDPVPLSPDGLHSEPPEKAGRVIAELVAMF